MHAFNMDIETTEHETCEKQPSLLQKKCDLALQSWKWNEVVGLVSYDNQQQVTDEDVDTEDTADSVKPLKTPRVTIQRRNRFSKFSHLPNDKDYRYVMIISVVFTYLFHN